MVLPVSTEAAVLSVTSTPTSLVQGGTVTLSVVVDSEGVTINNAEGTLVFPSEMFDVVSINKDTSLFSLWIQAPAYDGNNAISFNGGLPSPGYQGSNGKLFTVTLRSKASGSANLSLLNSAVRANDGLGTDVLRITRAVDVKVSEPSQSAPASEASQPTPASPATTPQTSKTPLVKSSTHPLENTWYSNTKAELSWTLPSGTDAIQTLLSRREGSMPTVLYRPPVSEKVIDSLEDGVWYFNIRARIDGAWGDIESYRLQVDTTVPQSRSLVTYDATSSILFIQASSQDEGSGIYAYEVFVDEVSYAKIMPEEFKNGFYNMLLSVNPGRHTLFVRVYDNALNYSDSESLDILAVRAPTLKDLIISKITSFDYRSLVLPTSLLISLLSVLMNLVLWRKLRQVTNAYKRPLKRITKRSRVQKTQEESERQ